MYNLFDYSSLCITLAQIDIFVRIRSFLSISLATTHIFQHFTGYSPHGCSIIFIRTLIFESRILLSKICWKFSRFRGFGLAQYNSTLHVHYIFPSNPSFQTYMWPCPPHFFYPPPSNNHYIILISSQKGN